MIVFKFIRFLFKSLFLAIGGLVALGVVAALIAPYFISNEMIEQRAEQAIAENTDMKLDIQGGASVSLIPEVNVSMKDALITLPDGQELFVPQLSARMSYPALLKKSIDATLTAELPENTLSIALEANDIRKDPAATALAYDVELLVEYATSDFEYRGTVKMPEEGQYTLNGKIALNDTKGDIEASLRQKATLNDVNATLALNRLNIPEVSALANSLSRDVSLLFRNKPAPAEAIAAPTSTTKTPEEVIAEIYAISVADLLPQIPNLKALVTVQVDDLQMNPSLALADVNSTISYQFPEASAKASLNLFDGIIKTESNIKRDNTGLVIDQQFSAENISLESALKTAGKPDLAKGVASTNGAFTARGFTVGDLVKSANGRLSVEAQNISSSALNVDKNMALLLQNATEVKEAKAEFRILDQTLFNDSFTASLPLMSLRGKGSADLAAYTVQYDVFAEGQAFALFDPNKPVLQVSGSLFDPSYTFLLENSTLRGFLPGATEEQKQQVKELKQDFKDLKKDLKKKPKELLEQQLQNAIETGDLNQLLDTGSTPQNLQQLVPQQLPNLIQGLGGLGGLGNGLGGLGQQQQQPAQPAAPVQQQPTPQQQPAPQP